MKYLFVRNDLRVNMYNNKTCQESNQLIETFTKLTKEQSDYLIMLKKQQKQSALLNLI